MVENLGSRNSYDYTSEQKDAIVNAAFDMARRIKNAFEKPSVGEHRDDFVF